MHWNMSLPLLMWQFLLWRSQGTNACQKCGVLGPPCPQVYSLQTVTHWSRNLSLSLRQDVIKLPTIRALDKTGQKFAWLANKKLFSRCADAVSDCLVQIKITPKTQPESQPILTIAESRWWEGASSSTLWGIPALSTTPEMCRTARSTKTLSILPQVNFMIDRYHQNIELISLQGTAEILSHDVDSLCQSCLL